MEENKKSGMIESDKDIVFSQAIKAGKRIYYIDVKKNRKEEMYISITESKKLVSGEGENTTLSFEKHKIFLYREDFTKFANSLRRLLTTWLPSRVNMFPATRRLRLQSQKRRKNSILT